MSNTNMLEYVKGIPGNLLTIIFGCICIVNSSNVNAFVEQEELQDLIADNLELIGRILVVLGIIKILVDWYVANSADQNTSNDSSKEEI